MTTISQPKPDLLKAIKSGQFKDQYLVYIRKSTDEPDNQKNSISYQKAENLRFAKKQGLRVANLTSPLFCTEGVISEKHSGFKESTEFEVLNTGEVRYQIDRPKFSQLVQFLNEGYFRGIVCLCWDRISRNRGDDTIVRKLMRKGVDFQFAFASYDNSSSGELHMDIDGMFAQHHSRVTSEKIKTTIRNKRAEGKCTYRAPIGYLNQGSWDHKPHDPKRAPIIAEMFELYATGDWSLSDLGRHVQKQGLTSVPMRKPRSQDEMMADEEDQPDAPKLSRPITINRISEILSNPFYTGKVIGPGRTYIPSTSHEPLVSQDMFDLVQLQLKRRKVSTHYVEKLDHPFRGFFRCAQCHRVYTPYTKKGHLYYNARCPSGCSNTLKNCSFDIASGKIDRILRGLVFSRQELTQLTDSTELEITALAAKQEKEKTRKERRAKRVREDLAYLDTNQIALLRSGAFTPETLVEERAKLDRELEDLQKVDQLTEGKMRDMLKLAIRLSELLKSLRRLYQLAKPHEKERIAKSVFSELRMSQNTLEYKLQNCFRPFENRILAFSAPNRWLSELLDKEEDRERAVKGLDDSNGKKS